MWQRWHSGTKSFLDRTRARRQCNALSRAVCFYRLGQLRDRTAEAQQHRASGLALVTAAITLWNTVHLGRALDAPRQAGISSPTRYSYTSPHSAGSTRTGSGPFGPHRPWRPFRPQPDHVPGPCRQPCYPARPPSPFTTAPRRRDSRLSLQSGQPEPGAAGEGDGADPAAEPGHPDGQPASGLGPGHLLAQLLEKAARRFRPPPRGAVPPARCRFGMSAAALCRAASMWRLETTEM